MQAFNLCWYLFKPNLGMKQNIYINLCYHMYITIYSTWDNLKGFNANINWGDQVVRIPTKAILHHGSEKLLYSYIHTVIKDQSFTRSLTMGTISGGLGAFPAEGVWMHLLYGEVQWPHAKEAPALLQRPGLFAAHS